MHSERQPTQASVAFFKLGPGPNLLGRRLVVQALTWLPSDLYTLNSFFKKCFKLPVRAALGDARCARQY